MPLAEFSERQIVRRALRNRALGRGHVPPGTSRRARPARNGIDRHVLGRALDGWATMSIGRLSGSGPAGVDCRLDSPVRSE
ncbi:MAG: hypothetical protein QM582_18455 [Micropruina sp.]|uniref:hypothetical protein n=1 Tax=Micropruina sp. TaxID=2737536 RepID=UPI0039E22EA1